MSVGAVAGPPLFCCCFGRMIRRRNWVHRSISRRLSSGSLSCRRGKYVVVLFDNGNLDINGTAAVGWTRFSNEIIDAVAATIAAPLRHMVFSVRVTVAVVVVAIVVVAVVEEGRANYSTNHCGCRFAKLGTKQLRRPKSRRRPTVCRVW
jgi:hypothetical protein